MSTAMQAKGALIARIQEMTASATSAKDVAYLCEAVRKLTESPDETGYFDYVYSYDFANAGRMPGADLAAIDPDSWPAFEAVGLVKMDGSDNPLSANYANYVHVPSASVMVAVRYFAYRWDGNTSNCVDGAGPIPSGFAIHRMFYDGGVLHKYVCVDKFQCSNNGGVAASVLYGAPLSTASAHNPINALSGAPSNTYGGCYAAAKTRGAHFALCSTFIYNGLSMLSLMCGQGATSNGVVAWWSATAANNHPKGNNNFLKDIVEPSLVFISDGYSNPASALCGSASNMAKTAHNGQLSGVVDLNGNMWEVASGVVTFADTATASAEPYYLLKTSVRLRDLTNDAGSDPFNTANSAYNKSFYDVLAGDSALGADDYGLSCVKGVANNASVAIGNTTATWWTETTGQKWALTCAGIPRGNDPAGSSTASVGVGTAIHAYAQDQIWRYRPDLLTVIRGGNWYTGSGAGLWAMNLSNTRTTSYDPVGLRACLYV